MSDSLKRFIAIFLNLVKMAGAKKYKIKEGDNKTIFFSKTDAEALDKVIVRIFGIKDYEGRRSVPWISEDKNRSCFYTDSKRFELAVRNIGRYIEVVIMEL